MTYSPKDIIFTYGGVPISGFADGTMIVVEPMAPDFTSYTGADGEGSRVANANKGVKITLTLAQTSISNDYLTACALVDSKTKVGQKAIGMKDLFGTSVVIAPLGYITQRPSMTLGKEIETREWVIESTSAVMTIGGNPLP